MKTIGNKTGRLQTNVVSFLLVMASFVVAQKSMACDVWMDITPQTTTDCDGHTNRCCYHFKLTSTCDMDSVVFHLPHGNSCWLLSCGGGIAVTVNELDGSSYSGSANFFTAGDSVIISFSGSNPVAPFQMEWNLCPAQSAGCNPVGLAVWGHSYLGGAQNKSFSTDLGGCGTGGGGGCSHCDVETVTDNGDPCYVIACFTLNNDNTSTGPFRLDIVPPYNNCTKPTGCAGSSVQLVDPTGWTTSGPSVNGFDEQYTFTPPVSYVLLQCSTFCIKLPKCAPPVRRYVRITDLADSTHCVQSSSVFAFKELPSGGGASDLFPQESNFPNPITSASYFRTTVPFVIPSGADARIVIVNPTGQIVHQETNTFAGGGKHFFYFTATDLPSGTYYYTIESPLGKTIVNRTLLVVK